jgi:opacity protein-like surface antigen
MRKFIVSTAVCALVVSAGAAEAQTRGGTIQGFGGTTLGTTATAPTFGGSVAIPLSDNLQIVGEAGRLTDIKAAPLDTALDFADLDVGMSAWYVEGGLRLIAGRHAGIRPYVEATAGVARLKPSVGVDGWLGAVTNTGLSFLGSTEPVVGAGGGVVIGAGPLALDLGYRYKRILANGALSTAFSLGNGGYDVNQVRIGVGVRF